jgi:cell division protein FtsW
VKRGELEGRLLVLVTLGLTAFGLVMVYSATSAAAAVGGKDPSYYLKRQGIYAAFGLVLLVLASRRDYRKLRAAAPTLLVITMALLLGVLAVGQSINGARRWISFGPAAFQPSELAKIALAVWVSAYLARKRPPRTLKELMRPIGTVAALACGLILVEPDLGTAIAIVCMLASILVVSGAPGRMLATATSIAVGAGLFLIWLEPYRRARVFAFLNPWGDSQGAGFQVVQAMIGLGSGGIFGVGLGQGVQKIFYLPEAHTDMIFAIVGEELGLVGSLCVMAAYATFAYAGFKIALACRDPFGKRLATGLTVLVSAQAAINLAAVMSLAPLTGIPLPFVSYGGSSLVVLLGSVGVLLNIAHGHGQTARRAAEVPDRSRGHGGTRAAGTRSRGSAPAPRRHGDVRRVAGARGSSARS